MEDSSRVDKQCIKCGKIGENSDLNQVGALYKKGQGKQHPLETIIEQARKVDDQSLLDNIKTAQENGGNIHIHGSCWTTLRNESRKKRKSVDDFTEGPAKRPCRRSENGGFDFTKQCFYCEKVCEVDYKHPDRNKFEVVATKDTKIYSKTLEICKKRVDPLAKSIERRLMSVNDFVAAEARYHKKCRSNFENPVPAYSSKGRPPCDKKLAAFEEVCTIFENEMDLWTLTEFHSKMSEKFDEVYSVKMTKTKLLDKYKDKLRLVNRFGKSDILILDELDSILTETWHKEKKERKEDEAERIIKTAARLLKNEIKNFEHDNTQYPTTTDILNTSNQCVPEHLKLFVNELIKAPLKQISISQVIFSAARPRSSLMPLLFALAVSSDNQLSSKWLVVLLSKLGFSISYDEVS